MMHLLAVLWLLIAGFNGTPHDYAAEQDCNVTAIWYYDGANEQWNAWFPQFEDPDYIAVPEAYQFMIDWMYADRGYWVACQKSSTS